MRRWWGNYLDDWSSFLVGLLVAGFVGLSITINLMFFSRADQPPEVWREQYAFTQDLLYDAGPLACSPMMQFKVHEIALYFPDTEPDWRLREDAVRMAWRDRCAEDVGLPTRWQHKGGR
jgi:hypothetical protein